MDIFVLILPLLAGWLLDKLIGDPSWLPHPIVGFGKLISFCEKRWNKGKRRVKKGACTAVVLIVFIYGASALLICYESLDRRGGFGRSYLLLFGRDYAYQ